MANLKRGEVTYTVDKAQGRIELYLPFGIGQTDARWTLMLQLPLNAVMADLQKLQGDLDAQRKSDTFGMAMVGLLIAGIGLLVIWLVGHGIARPLKQMVAMLDDIAKGEGDLTRRLTSDRADELGSIAERLQHVPGQVAGDDHPGRDLGAERQRLHRNTPPTSPSAPTSVCRSKWPKSIKWPPRCMK